MLCVFREAIALAKVRLSPLDPALEELYTLWAQQLTKDGNYEQAAKWYVCDKGVYLGNWGLFSMG